MKIKGSSALVTGGASGLGAATVRMLAANGAKVVIADVNEKGGNDDATPRFVYVTWKQQTAIAEIDRPEQRLALPRSRKRTEHRKVPEQDLKQQRQVAHHLYVGRGNPRHEHLR